MLQRLSVSNYALIDALEITFDHQLNIITGETGAGKSILLGALSLILGERGDARVIRRPDRKTVVEATFELDRGQLDAFLADNDIDNMGNECILRRELSPAGRSRAFVNDQPVSIAQLREAATTLVDIHSQHGNMRLAQPKFQLEVIDSLADNADIRGHYLNAYREMVDTRRELDQLVETTRRARADQDYIQFQLQQFETLALHENEDRELEAMQQRLANASDIKAHLWEVVDTLNGDREVTLLSQLQSVSSHLQSVEAVLSETAGMADRVDNAIIELKDIATTLAFVQDEVSDDPRQLEQVDQRLNDIYALERKHGVSSVNELLDLQHRLREQIQSVADNDERIEELTRCLEQQTAVAREWAGRLTATRHAAANRFAERLTTMASRLAMPNLNVDIQWKATELSPAGSDAVDLRLAFNKNQTPVPVKDTASGGEISRVMLCIKSIVAQSMALPTLIFDEVDTGVSGDIAMLMGEMMCDMAQHLQVIAITHLPQVAAQAHLHLKVFKQDNENETLTHVKKLTADEHLMEVARMLSGRDIDRAAIDNARSLINKSKKV